MRRWVTSLGHSVRQLGRLAMLWGIATEMLAPPSANALGHGLGMGLGIGGAKPFDPADLFAGGSVAGFWMDLDAAGAVAYNTQPSLGTAAASWTPTGCTFADSADVPEGQPGTSMLLTATAGGAVYALQTGRYVVGNRYTGGAWFKTDTTVGEGYKLTDATATPNFAISPLSATWTSVPHGTSYNAGNSSALLYRNPGAIGAKHWVYMPSATNISVTSVTCKGTLTPAAQATAVNMPYDKALGARNGLYFAADDGLVVGASKTTQRWLHDGTGCTLCFVVNVPALTTTQAIAGSALSNTGFRLLFTADGAIYYQIINGASVYVYSAQSAAGAIVAGQKQLVTTTFDSANGCKVYVNGLLVATDSTAAGALDTGDAFALATLGNLTTSDGLIGTLADAYGVAKYATDTELANLHRAFADKHGIKLATDPLTEAELATWTGLVSWLDPSAVTISYNTQPVLGSWVAEGGASLSTVGDALRVTGAAAARATQVLNAIGNRYVCTGAANGDGGTGYPAVLIDGATYDWQGTTSSASQAFTAEKTATNTKLMLWLRDAGYADFRNVAYRNNSITSIPERVGGGSYTQATAAYMPWGSTLNGLAADRFEGGDLVACSRAASLFKGMHDGTGGTCVFVLRPSTLNPSNIVVATSVQNQANVGWSFYYSATGAPGFTVQNGSGTAWAASGTGAAGLIAVNTTAIVSVKSDSAAGVVLRVNGALAASAALVSPSAANPTTGMMFGAHAGGSTSPLTGQMGDRLVFSRVLSLSELYRLEHMLAAPSKWNVTLA